MHLQILYSDDDFVAINKPSGLLVHRTPLDRHATVFALQLLRDQIDHEVFPCHRLDRPTSGVLLFALNLEALRFAQGQFAERHAKKIYHAVVRGWAEVQGIIEYPLRSEDNPSTSKDSRTDYTCVRQSEVDQPIGNYSKARFSLVELSPLTGRKHQLRRHLAHIRHPIIGDTRHGDGAQNKFIREHFNCQRLLLHASQLSIKHPSGVGSIDIRARYQSTFEDLVGQLNLSIPEPPS